MKKESAKYKISPKGKKKVDCSVKTSKGKSSKKLPLLGKTVYLDIKELKHVKRLNQDLKRLGATLEEFVSRDINYLITTQPRPKNKASPPCGDDNPSPSPFNCEPSPSPGNPEDRKVASVTRGKALAEKARVTSKAASTTLLDNAEKWGVKIVSLEGAFKWIDKELKKLPKSPGSQSKKSSKLSCVSSYKTFKSPFIKVEAESFCYRPFQTQLEVWPRLNVDTPRGSCPFDGTLIRCGEESREERGDLPAAQVDIPSAETPDAERGDNAAKPSTEKMGKKSEVDTTGGSRILTAGELRRRREQKRKQERKRGYCEFCHVKYEDLDKHVKEDQHRHFVRDKSNYQQLDSLISAGRTTQNFLYDCLAKATALSRSKNSGALHQTRCSPRKAVQEQTLQSLVKSPKKDAMTLRSPQKFDLVGKENMSLCSPGERHRKISKSLTKTPGPVKNTLFSSKKAELVACGRETAEVTDDVRKHGATTPRKPRSNHGDTRQGSLSPKVRLSSSLGPQAAVVHASPRRKLYTVSNNKTEEPEKQLSDKHSENQSNASTGVLGITSGEEICPESLPVVMHSFEENSKNVKQGTKRALEVESKSGDETTDTEDMCEDRRLAKSGFAELVQYGRYRASISRSSDDFEVCFARSFKNEHLPNADRLFQHENTFDDMINRSSKRIDHVDESVINERESKQLNLPAVPLTESVCSSQKSSEVKIENASLLPDSGTMSAMHKSSVLEDIYNIDVESDIPSDFQCYDDSGRLMKFSKTLAERIKERSMSRRSTSYNMNTMFQFPSKSKNKSNNKNNSRQLKKNKDLLLRNVDKHVSQKKSGSSIACAKVISKYKNKRFGFIPQESCQKGYQGDDEQENSPVVKIDDKRDVHHKKLKKKFWHYEPVIGDRDAVNDESLKSLPRELRSLREGNTHFISDNSESESNSRKTRNRNNLDGENVGQNEGKVIDDQVSEEKSEQHDLTPDDKKIHKSHTELVEVSVEYKKNSRSVALNKIIKPENRENSKPMKKKSINKFWHYEPEEMESDPLNEEKLKNLPKELRLLHDSLNLLDPLEGRGRRRQRTSQLDSENFVSGKSDTDIKKAVDIGIGSRSYENIVEQSERIENIEKQINNGTNKTDQTGFKVNSVLDSEKSRAAKPDGKTTNSHIMDEGCSESAKRKQRRKFWDYVEEKIATSSEEESSADIPKELRDLKIPKSSTFSSVCDGMDTIRSLSKQAVKGKKHLRPRINHRSYLESEESDYEKLDEEIDSNKMNETCSDIAAKSTVRKAKQRRKFWDYVEEKVETDSDEENSAVIPKELKELKIPKSSAFSSACDGLDTLRSSRTLAAKSKTCDHVESEKDQSEFEVLNRTEIHDTKQIEVEMSNAEIVSDKSDKNSLEEKLIGIKGAGDGKRFRSNLEHKASHFSKSEVMDINETKIGQIDTNMNSEEHRADLEEDSRLSSRSASRNRKRKVFWEYKAVKEKVQEKELDKSLPREIQQLQDSWNDLSDVEGRRSRSRCSYVEINNVEEVSEHCNKIVDGKNFGRSKINKKIHFTATERHKGEEMETTKIEIEANKAVPSPAQRSQCCAQEQDIGHQQADLEVGMGEERSLSPVFNTSSSLCTRVRRKSPVFNRSPRNVHGQKKQTTQVINTKILIGSTETVASIASGTHRITKPTRGQKLDLEECCPDSEEEVSHTSQNSNTILKTPEKMGMKPKEHGSGYSTPRERRRKRWKQSLDSSLDSESKQQEKKRRRLEKLKYSIAENGNNSASDYAKMKSSKKTLLNDMNEENVNNNSNQKHVTDICSNKTSDNVGTDLDDFSLLWKQVDDMEGDRNAVEENIRNSDLPGRRGAAETFNKKADLRKTLEENDGVNITAKGNRLKSGNHCELMKNIDDKSDDEYERYLPTLFSSPNKCSNSSWDEALDNYIDSSLKHCPDSSFKGANSSLYFSFNASPRKTPQKMENTSPWRITSLKSPEKWQSPSSPRSLKQHTPTKTVKYTCNIDNSEVTKVDEDIEFNFASPQKDRSEFSPLRSINGVVKDVLSPRGLHFTSTPDHNKSRKQRHEK